MLKTSIYSFFVASLITTSLNSQTTIKRKGGNSTFPKKELVGNLKTSAVMATLETFGYRASTTQTLDLTLHFTNYDLEYADSISITFPTGITPISSPELTFPTDDNNGGYEYLNGIIGQTITWGENNNDLYGGIFGRNLSFRVVVNVGAITGVKTGTFHLSGDGYFGINPSADYDGTFTISPKVAGDLRIVNYFIPYEGCESGTSETIELHVRNDGYNPITGTTTFKYKINSSPLITETTTVTIAPNDTLKYVYATTGNFSALGSYTVSASVANTLDLVSTNNSRTLTTITYPKNSIPYSSGFEPSPVSDLLNWYGEDNDSNYSWDTTNLTPHSGSTCFRMLETSPTTCDDWLFSPCLNLQSGKTYKVKYWTRLTSGYVGSLGVFLNYIQYSDAIDQTLMPLTPLVDNSTWTKDSTTFNVSSDGIYHVGFEAVNNTEEIIALRLDDFSVVETGAVSGIGTFVIDDISVYPNPTSNKLTVFSPNTLLTIEFYNTMGQIVMTYHLNSYGKTEIDISALANGAYTLKVSNDRNVGYKKIIKKS